MECSAIGATFGVVRPKGKPLLVGSVKTNIGHMEGASGLAGLIKAVFTLEKGQIAPNLWFEKVNPRIRLDEWGIEVSNSRVLSGSRLRLVLTSKGTYQIDSLAYKWSTARECQLLWLRWNQCPLHS